MPVTRVVAGQFSFATGWQYVLGPTSVAELSSFATITGDSGGADPLEAEAQIIFRLEGTGGTLNFSARVGGAQSVHIVDIGLTSNVALTGTANNDILYGSAYADTLNGGTGADVMAGGGGNDTYSVDNIGDQLNEFAGGGIDTVRTTLSSYTLGAEVDRLVFTGVGSFVGIGNALANGLTGGAGNDTLEGGDGNDTLNGGAGADAMTGGAGNDTYYVDNVGDTVTEIAGGGIDAVLTTLSSYTLGAEVDRLVFTGSGNFVGTGNALANGLTGGAGNDTLEGGDGNDTLNGGAGADAMTGGGGNDTYYVDNVGDTVTEVAGGGIDMVVTTLSSYTLGAEVDRVKFTGSGDFVGIGNALANGLTGGAGNDTLDGGDGNDTLNGGAGADAMTGGAGNDTYYVDNVGDTVTEIAGGGIDAVLTTLSSYTLGADVERLVFTGSGDFVGTGNALANRLTGGAGTDILLGGDGNDWLDGVGRGSREEKLDGGAGIDTVSYASRTGGSVDVNLAIKAEGFPDDMVLMGSINIDTPADFWVYYGGMGSSFFIYLSGFDIWSDVLGIENIVGSSFGDKLTGDSGNNVIEGGGGADTINGNAGADTIRGDAGNDTIQGAADDTLLDGGADTDTLQVAANFTSTGDRQIINIENVTLTAAVTLNLANQTEGFTITGSSGADIITGSSGADSITGGSGNDVIAGGAGVDAIDGGTGSNTFVVNAVVGSSSDSSRVANAGNGNDTGQDTITGFDLTNDTLKIVATNVQSFRHVFDTTVGAGTGLDDGRAGGFTTSTGLVDLNKATDFSFGDAGDIAVTFTAPTGAFSKESFEARLQYDLTGTSGSDLITTGALNDTIKGGRGADFIDSGGGSDLIIVSAVVGSSSDSSRVVGAGNGDDTGQDKIHFDFASDLLKIVATNVSSFVHGADTAMGTAGGVDDGTAAGFATGTGLVDLNQATDGFGDAGDIAVTFANEMIFPPWFESTFEGQLVYDLTGTSGADTITTGIRDDRIQGGGGADILNGGSGNDVFVFAATGDSTAAAFDTITGFSHGSDKIEFANIAGIHSFQALVGGGSTVMANSISWSESGGNTHIYVNTTGVSEAVGAAQMEIVLTGTGLGLTATDFLFT